VDILAAQQGVTNMDWYQGTADAVRKQVDVLDRKSNEHVLILAGDHLYKMDYREMMATHIERDADITVAAIPIERSAVSALGIMLIDDEGLVREFHEKPSSGELLDRLETPPEVLRRLGSKSDERPYLASMGIYLFKREVLVDFLRRTEHVDFGQDILPEAIGRCRVAAHYFDGYWEDVGTVSAYFRSQLALCSDPRPPFLFHGTNATRIFSRPRFLPASRCMGAHIERSTVSDGCILYEGCQVKRSLLGLRSIIRAQSRLEDTIVNGADFYDDHMSARNPSEGPPHIGIGSGCKINRAILDKNVRIGDGVVIRDASGRPDFDGPDHYVRDGVVIIPKDTVIESGTVI
jgi:glucose-1-phosphate adenylyltransferase